MVPKIWSFEPVAIRRVDALCVLQPTPICTITHTDGRSRSNREFQLSTKRMLNYDEPRRQCQTGNKIKTQNRCIECDVWCRGSEKCSEKRAKIVEFVCIKCVNNGL